MRPITKAILFFLLISFFGCQSNHPEKFLFKGDDFYRKGQYDKAIEQYDLAIQGNKYYAIAYISKGQAFEFEKKFDEAIQTYNSLLEILPDYTEAMTRRGICYLKIQKLQDAFDDLEMANSKEPSNSQILSNLGMVKMFLNDSSGIQDLNEAIFLDSTSHEAYYHRGLSQLFLQNFSEAINDFEQAIKNNSEFGEAYFSLGICKFQLGNNEEACKYWKLAVEKGYSNEKAILIIEQNCQ